MRLTQFSNFAVRILMYAGLNGHGPSPIPEIARAYGISFDHLKKAAAELSHLGYLKSVRGRSGGVCLVNAPEAISIGEVVRQTEGSAGLAECFDLATNTCPLHADCKFRVALQEALEAFYTVLDRHTLADLVENRETLIDCLGINAARSEEGRPVARPIGCRRLTSGNSDPTMGSSPCGSL